GSGIAIHWCESTLPFRAGCNNYKAWTMAYPRARAHPLKQRSAQIHAAITVILHVKRAGYVPPSLGVISSAGKRHEQILLCRRGGGRGPGPAPPHGIARTRRRYGPTP